MFFGSKTLKHFLCAFALLIGSPFSARAADDDNPFKNVKEGDWVKFSMTMVIGDFKVAGEFRKTVTAKSDKEVTIKTEMTLNGAKSIPSEEKIDLTKPHEPIKLLGLKESDTKIEKVSDAKEKLRIGTKEYECVVLKLKTKSNVGVMQYNSDVRLWTSKDVPLGGMVKLEVLGERGVPANTWLEFKESGSK
jgi:hypothetical protein